ncbi:hypothetical protein CRENBAI_014936 [Crenichthys baileyi]|uniref:Uncharacterized protein n=1 Tax=Crenichthys baileyi TaxID=28760 RepID=A0AAV9RRF9_9TELE
MVQSSGPIILHAVCVCVFKDSVTSVGGCFHPDAEVVSLNKNFFVLVRRAQCDVFVTESWLVALMLTDCNCEIEYTVSALTQHFLCGKRSLQTGIHSVGAAQPQALCSG